MFEDVKVSYIGSVIIPDPSTTSRFEVMHDMLHQIGHLLSPRGLGIFIATGFYSTDKPITRENCDAFLDAHGLPLTLLDFIYARIDSAENASLQKQVHAMSNDEYLKNLVNIIQIDLVATQDARLSGPEPTDTIH